MVSNGYRRHVHILYALHQLLDIREAVQQRVLRVDMQVGKGHGSINIK
jgi:hypothetical protein